jgi:hypothetical protein
MSQDAGSAVSCRPSGCLHPPSTRLAAAPPAAVSPLLSPRIAPRVQTQVPRCAFVALPAPRCSPGLGSVPPLLQIAPPRPSGLSRSCAAPLLSPLGTPSSAYRSRALPFRALRASGSVPSRYIAVPFVSRFAASFAPFGLRFLPLQVPPPQRTGLAACRSRPSGFGFCSPPDT